MLLKADGVTGAGMPSKLMGPLPRNLDAHGNAVAAVLARPGDAQAAQAFWKARSIDLRLPLQ